MKKNTLAAVLVTGRGETIACATGIRDSEENRIKPYSTVFININKYATIVVRFTHFIMYDSTTSSWKFGWEFQYNNKLFKADFLDLKFMVKKQIEAWRAVCKNQRKAGSIIVPRLLPTQNDASVLPKFIHKIAITTNWYERIRNADFPPYATNSPEQVPLTSWKYKPNNFIGRNIHCNLAIIQIFLIALNSFLVDWFASSFPPFDILSMSLRLILGEWGLLKSASIDTSKNSTPFGWKLIVENRLWSKGPKLNLWWKVTRTLWHNTSRFLSR